MVYARIRNLAWIFVDKFSLVLLSMASFFTYALYMTPAEFGLGVLAVAIVEAVGVVYCMMLEDPLVRRPAYGKTEASSVFWLGGLATALSMLLVTAGTWLLADSQTLWMLVGFAASKVVAVVVARPFVAELRRKRNFKALAMRAMLGKVCGALVGIYAALQGAGAWAIVAQAVIMDYVALMVLMYSGWRKVLGNVQLSCFISIVKEGAPLAAKSAAYALGQKGMIVLLGVTTSASVVGYYAFATRLVELPRSAIANGLTSYSMPAMAARANAKAGAAQFFTQLTVMTSLFWIPLFIGAAMLGSQLIVPIFGEKWQQVVPLFEFMAFMTAISCIIFYIPSTLAAYGRGAIGLRTDVIVTLGTLGVLYFASAEWQLMGVVVALSFRFVASVITKNLQLRQVMKVDHIHIFKQTGKVMLAALVMGWLARTLYLSIDNLYYATSVALLAGATCYLTLITLLKRVWVQELRQFMLTRQ